MTTEAREQKRAALLRVSPLELRLYVAAFLATVYAISWRAISGHAPTTEALADAPPGIAAPPPRVVWLDSLPVTARPAVVLPAGWHIVAAPDAVSSAPSRAVRAPVRRAPRVRTRSS